MQHHHHTAIMPHGFQILHKGVDRVRHIAEQATMQGRLLHMGIKSVVAHSDVIQLGGQARIDTGRDLGKPWVRRRSRPGVDNPSKFAYSRRRSLSTGVNR